MPSDSYGDAWPRHPMLSRLPWRRRRQMEENALTFELCWGDLARYNAERSRGIEHTPEHKARMAEKQADYDRRVRGHTAAPR